MNCRFEVGQRVVAINDAGWYPLGGGDEVAGPTKGNICKIIGIRPTDFHYADGSPIIALKFTEWSGEYANRSFRPLNERPKETSIDVFKKFTQPVKETA